MINDWKCLLNIPKEPFNVMFMGGGWIAKNNGCCFFVKWERRALLGCGHGLRKTGLFMETGEVGYSTISGEKAQEEWDLSPCFLSLFSYNCVTSGALGPPNSLFSAQAHALYVCTYMLTHACILDCYYFHKALYSAEHIKVDEVLHCSSSHLFMTVTLGDQWIQLCSEMAGL